MRRGGAVTAHRRGLVVLTLTALVLGTLSVGLVPAPLGRRPADAAVALTGSEPGHRLVSIQAQGSIDLAELARSQTPSTPSPGRFVVSPPLPAFNPVAIDPGVSADESASIPIGPLAPSPAPLLADFEALADNNTAIPPDTTGAVGPNDLMTTLNSEFLVQDRFGAELVKTTIETFWGLFFTVNVFDPRVVYDSAADRWVIVTLADARLASSAVLVAVSDTGDPAGTWTGYSIDADASDVVWADFPNVGFNDQWLVITLNMFANSNDAFIGSETYVLDRLGLYGGVAAPVDVFIEAGLGSSAPMIANDANVDIMYLVGNWDPANGDLRLSSITGPVGAPVFNPGIAFPSGAPWDFNGPDAPQLGSIELIATNDARIGQPCSYRNGSLWCTHHVYLPAGAPTRASIQWWKLDPQTGTVQQSGRIDDPSGATFYTFPSIAVNKYNDVLIGYSRFSATQWASANYAFRYGTDPAGTFRDDRVLFAGEAPYSKDFGGPSIRFGDYSATVVDPVNDLNLWTIQEYAAAPSGGFDRWGTWWGAIPVAVDTIAPVWPGGAVLAVTSVKEDEVSLSWPAASDIIGLADYQIFQDGVLVGMSASTTFTATGLVLGQTYGFVVEATDLEGNQTIDGPTVMATTVDTTPPVWPGGAALDPSEVLETTLTLDWPDATDNAGGVGYQVFQNGVMVLSGSNLAALTTSMADIVGLAAATDYTFVVQATDGAGNVTTNGPSVSVTTAIDFPDTEGSQFEDDIAWMSGSGITQGCTAPPNSLYCPADPVTRAQMASFLVRALNLPAVTGNRFSDVSGTHTANINALAAAGVTLGCNTAGTLYCPDEAVNRAQMGSFLARALMLAPIPGDRFADVSGTHEPNINAIADQGITLGCVPDGSLYCPDEDVTRAQMAAFLHRALG